MIILGGGRVGTALSRRAVERAVEGVTLVTRSVHREALEGPAGVPILVCVREEDLADVIADIPGHRQADLVFIQNGMLDDFLSACGLDVCTRGLLFFAVPSRLDDLTPGPPSPFTGPHAARIVEVFGALDVPAREVERAEFTAVMLEKLIWNCAFGLMCQVHGASVGEVCDAHIEELSALVGELAAVGERGLGVALERGPLLERLCAYSRSIADYRGAVKAWKWRNGWFFDGAARHGVETPLHLELLRRSGALPV